MYSLMIMALVVAFVALLCGGLGSLFAQDAGPGERILMALMTSATAFVATLILGLRDLIRFRRDSRRTQQHLLERPDFFEAEFRSEADVDPELMKVVREAIAQFFDVPVSKIRPTDNFETDLHIDPTEVNFQHFVIRTVADDHRFHDEVIEVNFANAHTVEDLVIWLQDFIRDED
ncbi:hypothetical protein KOR42_30700 [Thalassoglobus neptunius]|uniref:Uncharacterized protein n=1 Tax=Thalassoglobus neptunius TaxID=1938619 RepID=A0A5C5WQX6_9PLAN|nr:hypothetical protein [Thalassoglobus neptunius]TWT52202.1 hypothetical protein KOR42_30700 [Thalassoglobus neptunius]